MNTFVNSVRNQRTTTTNGMSAYKATGNNCTTLFFKIGASRGKNIVPDFVAAYAEDREIALRIAQWARDARGGSGERKLFRDILAHLAQRDPDAAVALVYKTPEIGRWDDLLIEFGNDVVKFTAFAVIRDALAEGLKAKELLGKIDQMSEEECQHMLDTVYN